MATARIRLRKKNEQQQGPSDFSHPRTILTGTGVADLRTALANSSTFRARWQTAISQFEDTTGTPGWWSRDDKGSDYFNRSFAAFLTMVRRPTNDLGLTWANSWQYYRDRIITNAMTMVGPSGRTGWDPQAGDDRFACIGICLVYDWLYNDMNDTERSFFEGRIAEIPLGTGLGYDAEAWDNGNSGAHVRSILRRLVLNSDWETLRAGAYDDHVAVMDSINWMHMGFGLGREWHAGHPSRPGHFFLAMCLKNALGMTESQTIDKIGMHLRDVWMLTSLTPVPALNNDTTPDPFWGANKFHTQDTLNTQFHFNLGCGSHMLWAAALLPGMFARGAVSLSNEADSSNQAALANSESDYFAYLWWKLNEPFTAGSTQKMINVTNTKFIGLTSGSWDATRNEGFWAFPPWLIYNVQETTPNKNATDAGVVRVKRWQPGTTDWTMIHSAHSRTTRRSIWYVHRRYGASTYEEGTRHNGTWDLHRNGPLLIRMGTGGHSFPTQSGTYFYNGAITFYKASLYDKFGWANAGATYINEGNEDCGGQRVFAPAAGARKTTILAEPTADYGQVLKWSATANGVYITDDLTRCYNSTAIQYGDLALNAVKVGSNGLIREFAHIMNDGSGRGKVFTYDRVHVHDTTYEPRLSICPGPPPNIDGTEVPYNDFPTDSSDPARWYAVGPVEWDYTSATRLIVDNSVEPGSPNAGNGKCQVTWLEPTGALIKRMGGHNARKHSGVNGDPHFDPWACWWGEQYSGYNLDSIRAYVGDSVVYVRPPSVTSDVRFLMAYEDMLVGDTPSTAEKLTCDANSVAARAGTAAVVFAKENSGHTSGSVTVPTGVTFVVLLNLPASTTMTLGGTSTVSSPGRITNSAGVLEVTLSAVGTLTFS